MTSKTHYTSVATWTPDAWVTRQRVTVAGGAGDTSVSGFAPGRGAILAVIMAAVPLSVGPGSIAGGARGTSGAPSNLFGGKGGAGSFASDIYAGGGSGASSRSNGVDGGAPGVDAPSVGRNVDGSGGKANGDGGAAGTGGISAGAAGKSRANGGTGGAGGSTSGNYDAPGGGGGGFGGGGGGAGGTTGAGGGGSSSGGSSSAALVGYNSGTPYVDVEVAATPLQPTPLSPTNNTYIDRTIDQVFSFQSNPASSDVLDAQTDAIFEYRLVGAGSWTSVSNLGTATAATIAANTLAIGSYEGRFRTKADGGVGDALGVWGPNSEVFYFRADDPAVAPVVTSPQPNDVVAVNSATAAWTVTSQTSYQMRVVGDDSGTPATGVIYADSGEVISTDRTKTLTIGANHVAAHVQVRVRNKTNGVWSAWASVAVTIEWAGPPKPRVTLATDVSSMFVTVTNPPPVGVEPVADRIEVYVHENGVRERRAILAPGEGWIYETPPSGVEVGIEAVAIYTPTNVMTSSGVIY